MATLGERIEALANDPERTKAFLASLDADAALFPGHSCGCIYHALIAANIDLPEGTKVRVLIDEIIVYLPDGTKDRAHFYPGDFAYDIQERWIYSCGSQTATRPDGQLDSLLLPQQAIKAVDAWLGENPRPA
jgi:hypothetical protein